MDILRAFFGGRDWRFLLTPAALLVFLLAVTAYRGPNLFTSNGLAGAILVSAPLLLAVLALTPIVLVGRGSIDLSIGPLIGFINVSFVHGLVGNGITSPILLIAYAISMGVAYQALLALVIIYVRVAPIIVSLSGYLVLSGINLAILPRPSGTVPEWMSNWGAGSSVLSPITLIVIFALIGWAVLSRSVFFRNVRLTGDDERAAYASGVNVDLARFGAHLVGGAFAGLAALCFTALIGSGDPTQGNTYTLTAITALVLGGANLSGGRATARGAVLGAIDMYLIIYVLTTLDFGIVSGFVAQLSYGLALVISMLLGTRLSAAWSK